MTGLARKGEWMGLGKAIVVGWLVLMVGNAVQAATLQVGPGKQYDKPSAAIAAARPGDTVDIAPGQYYDCVDIRQDNLTIEGAGPGTVLTDTTCAGKAILIIDGNNITIRNLTLQRARVPDANGAGIRAEGGDLTVDHVHFLNNQNGILSAPNPKANIRIIDSEFVHNGTCQRACAHGIYIGQVHSLLVQHSRFFETQQGHSIKSGALLTEVIDCDIEDGPDGTSSYLIDVMHGGSLVVTGTRMEKGPKSENYGYAITIGEEGVTQPTDRIVIKDNTFINDTNHPTTFVRNVTATPAQLSNNKFTGQVRPLEGDGSSS
jgi:Right handed beta helix region